MANSSNWKNRIRRLTSMDREEVVDRLRQYSTARADALRYRSGHEFVSTDQNHGALGSFFFAPEDLPVLGETLQKSFPAQAQEIVALAEQICQHSFNLLGYEKLNYGAEIDWHQDIVHGKRAPQVPWFKVKYLDFEQVGDAKVTWELNRHQHLVTLAKTYVLTGDDKYAREIFSQWESWKKANPYPIGINWASSLEVAFRSISWTWTFFLLSNCVLWTEERRKEWLHALQVHGRHIENYLSTYFSPNTHLLGEALALFFLGILFPALPLAARWRERGWTILLQEAGKQVRADGVYGEQSVYYHVYAVDFFLHARILAARNGITIPAEFDANLERMLNALLLLGRTGIAATFGDDDGGRLFDSRRNRAEHLLDPLATGAVIYSRGDFKAVVPTVREETLWLLGTGGVRSFERLPAVESSFDSEALVETGLYVMADWSTKTQLIIDAGGLGFGSGGHGHADALNISLFQNGQTLLGDSGTFEYIGDSGERERLRGTAAHNTLQVDGLNQAEVKGPFAWKNHPKVTVERWIKGKTFEFFQGSHDGYIRLTSPVVHRRLVFHKKGEFWLVLDRAEGCGRHQLAIAWHVGPVLSRGSSDVLAFTAKPMNEFLEKNKREAVAQLMLLGPQAHGWTESVRSEDFSPVYGRKESAPVVNFSVTAELPTEFATLLFAGSGAAREHFVKLQEKVQEKEVCENKKVSAYRYCKNAVEHEFFVATGSNPWAQGGWASDAELLYSSFDHESNQHVLIICHGSYVEAEGHRVLSSDGPLSYAEITSTPAKVEMNSSDPANVLAYNRPEKMFEMHEVSVHNRNPDQAH